MRSREVAVVVVMALGTAGFIACGSRTGLPFDEALDVEDDSGKPDVQRPMDAADEDVIEEPLPPLDASRRDASRMDCLDAGDTQIYVITEDTNELLAFYPPQGTFRRIGVIACPTILPPPPNMGVATPFSMAVDRKGVAYILFNDLHIYRVSTATAACVATPFRASQLGFNTFGMGFSTNMAGPAETLFVAADNGSGGTSSLGSIDVTSFDLSRIGGFTPVVARAELTGTGDGRLFAFYTQPSTGTEVSYVGEIDKDNAHVIAADQVPVNQRGGYAFGFWGGDFYLFTGSPTAAGSIVTRFRPSDKTTVVVGAYPALIVGAGVSTCAPQ
ncbi:MAG: hypothetical protein ABIP39_12015 [Polyangiaceae bacterium]